MMPNGVRPASMKPKIRINSAFFREDNTSFKVKDIGRSQYCSKSG
jgi:hypothetical protein